MKRLTNILLILCTASALLAQDTDHTPLSDVDIQGTARYVSMGGAFAALGGDVSAVKDNPAALGVFRREEVSISLDWSSGYGFTDATQAHTQTKFTMPQLSWVFSIGDSQKQKGMILNNFVIQYQRLKSYNQNTSFTEKSLQSQTDIMAAGAYAQGLFESDMQTEDVWDNPNIGWLSLVGYNGYLINPDTINLGDWIPLPLSTEQVQKDLQIYETGSVDEYTLGWGTNLSNTLYLGLSANMRTLSYQKVSDYTEEFELGGAYNLKTTVTANGLGFNAALGAIYRPVSFVRLAASFQTPTWMSLNRQNYATLYTNGIIDEAQKIETPMNSAYDERYLLPMRVVGGAAFQIGMRGLVSLEYDYAHTPHTQNADQHFLKIGTEWIINRNFFLRAGYAYQSAFQQEDTRYAWAYNDTRTDTDFRLTQSAQYISAGFGWRNKRWITDIAYQFRLASSHQYLFAEQTAPIDLQTQTHRIVFTFGWTKPQ